MSASLRNLTCAAVFMLFACDSLVLRAGADFQIELVSQTPIRLRQAVAPIEIRFRLPGCEAFTLSAVRDGDVLELATTHQDDGTFVAPVPVSFMTSAACFATDDTPLSSSFSLVATCEGDRRKTGARVAYEVVSTAWQWPAFAGSFSDSAVLHALPDTRVLVVGGGQLLLGEFGPDGGHAHTAAAFMPSGSTAEQTRLASDGARVYLSFQCPIGDCGFGGSVEVDVEGAGPQTVLTEPLFEFELAGDRIDFRRAIQVSPHTDLAFDSDGDLVLLGGLDRSHVIPFPVSLVRLSAGQLPRFQRIGPSLSASNFTRLADGRLAYLNAPFGLSPTDSPSLVTPQGEELQSFTADQDKFDLTWDLFRGPVTRIDPLQPRWLTLTSSGAWVGGHLRAWQSITVDPALDQRSLTASWLSDAVVLWDSGLVQLIPLEGSSRAPVRIASARANLRGVAGNENFLVVTSTTGVQIFGRAGELLGGADPFPCGWTPTSAPLVQSQRVLVTTTGRVLGFDLSSN